MASTLIQCESTAAPVEPYAVIGSAAWGKCPTCGERHQLLAPSTTTGPWRLPRHNRKR